MANISIVPMYVEGQSILVPQARIYNQEALEDFLTRDFSRLGHNYKRLSIIPSLNAEELPRLNMIKIYNQYLGSFYNTNYSVGKEFELVVGDIYKYADLIEELVMECSERMPVEFDYNGKDNTWLTFGDFIILVYETGTKRIAGFCTFSAEYSGLISLNLLYVKPEYRKQGYSKALLEYAFKMAEKILLPSKLTGKLIMKITTDTTKVNPLNAALIRLNFTLTKHYWRTI